MKTAKLFIAAASFLIFACSGDGGTAADSGIHDGGTAADSGGGTIRGDTGIISGGTWLDPATGLTWQNMPDEVELLQQEAIDHCDDLILAGHGNWRLPTIGELRSLLKGCPGAETGATCGIQDDCLLLSCTNTSCDGCAEDDGPDSGCYWIDALDGICGSFWSSSSVEDDGTYAWYIHFNYGGLGYSDKGDINRVRCVASAS